VSARLASANDDIPRKRRPCESRLWISAGGIHHLDSYSSTKISRSVGLDGYTRNVATVALTSQCNPAIAASSGIRYRIRYRILARLFIVKPVPRCIDLVAKVE